MNTTTTVNLLITQVQLVLMLAYRSNNLKEKDREQPINDITDNFSNKIDVYQVV